MDQQVEDLAAYIHASCVELVFKVHDEKHTSWEEAQKAARRPAVRIMLESKVFRGLRRCEPNCDLDAGTLHLLADSAEQRRQKLTTPQRRPGLHRQSAPLELLQ